MRLNGSPIFYIVLGSLWLVAAVLKAIEKPMFVGPVYWPIVIYGAVGVCFYAFAIVVIVKQRQNNK